MEKKCGNCHWYESICNDKNSHGVCLMTDPRNYDGIPHIETALLHAPRFDLTNPTRNCFMNMFEPKGPRKSWEDHRLQAFAKREQNNQ